MTERPDVVRSLEHLREAIVERRPDLAPLVERKPAPEPPRKPLDQVGGEYESSIAFPETGWTGWRPVTNGKPLQVPPRAVAMMVRKTGAAVPPMTQRAVPFHEKPSAEPS